MTVKESTGIEEIYKHCRLLMGSDVWGRLAASLEDDYSYEIFAEELDSRRDEYEMPVFISDLARLELAFYHIKSSDIPMPQNVERTTLNPTFQIHQMSWKGLHKFIGADSSADSIIPESGDELVMVWRDPETGIAELAAAGDNDLLALKVVVEGLDPDETAAAAGIPVGRIDLSIALAVQKGILLSPPSLIRRDPANYPMGEVTDESLLAAEVFTLQWHITQACDLHCKHCYDRSSRSTLRFEDGIRILDDMRSFCLSKHVSGQISFSGGNPFLHPDFVSLYRAASERAFALAILGNPVPRVKVEEVLKIEKPVFFQVSLEGLKAHNDTIRGEGNFDSVMGFLELLKELDIYSMVMLTLTSDNMDQVLPLAELLRDRVDLFNFNRLAMVGEGTSLRPPSPEEYASFLQEYMKATESNPIMGVKDNFINILRYRKKASFFGGCAGHGCGAAFNFVSVLPDGEVHACRKLPSKIGNILEHSLSGIYESEIANRYRCGPSDCRECPIRPVCGGCLAVSYGHGLDIFKERDPFCFMK